MSELSLNETIAFTQHFQKQIKLVPHVSLVANSMKKRHNELFSIGEPIRNTTQYFNSINHIFQIFSKDKLYKPTAFRVFIPEILSNIDVTELNNTIQQIYENIPENIDIDFDEETQSVAENIQAGIDDYNAISNTLVKVNVPIYKITNTKNFCYIIFLIIFIVIMSLCSESDLKDNFVAVLNSIIATEISDTVKKSIK